MSNKQTIILKRETKQISLELQTLKNQYVCSTLIDYLISIFEYLFQRHICAFVHVLRDRITL